ncbi:hypothetical protein B296_00036417 [Ensete ventricosum]|uniref:Endonuclease/exonuclease/phosphatase domain-containing protein n=1 Tax=Ensete ventricosum TaxID=4639 RepID=A0A427A2R7_ENSVE|nr:hypothetical protein B296_00036417 [Ensete ventricosum]
MLGTYQSDRGLVRLSTAWYLSVPCVGMHGIARDWYTLVQLGTLVYHVCVLELQLMVVQFFGEQTAMKKKKLKRKSLVEEQGRKEKGRRKKKKKEKEEKYSDTWEAAVAAVASKGSMVKQQRGSAAVASQQRSDKEAVPLQHRTCKQVRTLLHRAYAVSKIWNDAPVIVCGDFNSTPKVCCFIVFVASIL